MDNDYALRYTKTLLPRSDPSMNYVHSRSNSKTKKDRRNKVKRRTSKKGHGIMSASASHLDASASSLNSSSLNNSNGSLTMDFSGHESNGVTTSRVSTNRAGVSPSFYSDITAPDSVFDYGTKYVRPKTPEAEEDSLLQSSANADPNDPLAGFDNFQDEFEDEMDEIEMHSMNKRSSMVSLSDLEAKSTRRGRLRKCSTICCVFIVLGAIAGVVVWAVASKGSKGKTLQAVPEASKLLKLWCAEDLDLGPGQSATFPLEAPEDCKEHCLPAECCWNPNSEYECTPETERFCSGYKTPCDIMIHPITKEPAAATTQAPDTSNTENDFLEVPMAPPTLKTICVPEGPSFTATPVCHDICLRAECCWNIDSTMECSQ